MCTSEKLSPCRQEGPATGATVLPMHFIYLSEYFTLVLHKMEGHGEGGGCLPPRQISGVIAKPYVILPEVSPLVMHYEMITTVF